MNITKTKINMMFLVLVSLAVVFSFGIGAVSADPSIIYVNDASGNDTWNGEASVWDGLTLLGPKKSIKNATGTVTTGGTVNIADGIYTGSNNTNITITRNMNITGQSQSGTIINATGTPLTRMFTISNGASVTISNLTFVNGNSTSGGAIYLSGTTTIRSYLTVNNCAFISNKATDGGAISNLRSTLTVNNCSFINNFASSDGGAIMIESGTQAVYYVYNSTFIGNSANSYGGAIEQWGGTSSIINGNTFIDNYANFGGAIHKYGGTAEIHFNRFYNNTAPGPGGVTPGEGGDDICYAGGSAINAQNNWYGSNDSPAAKIYQNYLVNFTPWIVLTVTADPGTVIGGGTSNITADLLHDSTGGYHDPASGHVPDGISVNFAGDTLGTLNPLSSTIINGQANTIFTAGSILGISNVTATIDNASVSANINIIDFFPTILVVDPVPAYVGDTVNLTATLTDTIHNSPVSGKTVNFTVDGSPVGSAVTDASGLATYSYTITQGAGIYQILAEFAGDATYTPGSGTNNLNVSSISTSLIVNSTSGYYGNSVNLTAILTDTIHNSPVSGKTVNFTVDGSPVGSAVTDASGLATYSYTITQGAGIYQILAEFMGEGGYNASSGTNNLTVSPALTYLAVNPASGTTGDNVTLTATLWNINPIAGVSGRTIDFYVNNVLLGSSSTDINGIATWIYNIIQGVGVYPGFIKAVFAGDPYYAGAIGFNTLTVGPETIPPTVNATPSGGLYNTTQNVILTANEPATIYYTTDGTDPTTSSTQYTVPIIISANTVLKFFAVDTAGNQSGIYTETYTIDTTAPTASANPAGGLYNTTQSVVLSSNEPATIYYTTDSSNPTTSSTQYTVPIIISANTVLKFFAVDTAGNSSGIYTETYAIDTTAPTASATPAGGSYNATQNVVLSTDPDAVIYYTTDGTDPTTSSTQYTVPIIISANTVLKFFAVDLAGNQSGIYIENYIIDTTAPIASANPVGGTYNTAQSVVLTSNESAIIYYTTDGSDPQTSGTRSVYSSPIAINNTTTLRFSAVDSLGNWSPVYNETYTINFGFTVDQIKAAALTVRAYIETYYSLPNNVTINGTSVSMSQFLELLMTATLQLNNGNTNLILLGTYSGPTNPIDDIKVGNIFKTEYLKIANDLKTYMDTTGKTPDYQYQTSLGVHLGFQNLIYMYSQILSYQSSFNRFPDYVAMKPWSSINSQSAAIIPNGPTFTISEIKAAALTVKTYVDMYYNLPGNVQIGSYQISMAQFLELLMTATLQLNNGNTNPIPLRTYNAPVNPIDDIKAGNIFQAEYFKIANDLKTYMDTTGRTPDYQYQTSLGVHLGYQNLIYMYSQILSYQSSFNKLPDFVAMKPWSSINSQSVAIIPNGPTFTIDQIKDAATIVKTYVETNQNLPADVTINGTNVSMAQFLELLMTATLQLNNGNTNPIPLRTYNAPVNPIDDITTGNILKTEYLKIANDLKTYMDTTGRTPDYQYQTSLGVHLGYQNLIYMYSQILDYHKTNGTLPNYISMEPWRFVSSPTLATFTITQIKDAATTVKTYIEANKNIPVDVTINGTSVNMSQFLELLMNATLQLISGTNNPILLKNYSAPTNPIDDIKAGNIFQAEYLKIANDLRNYMHSTGKTPDYQYQTSLGLHLGFQNLIYMYSQILDYQKNNNNLPVSIAMKPWSLI